MALHTQSPLPNGSSTSRYLPFLFMGVAALSGALFASAPAPTDAPPLPHPHVANDGSVKVTTQLERTHLLANQRGETFARITLEGVNAPTPKERLPISLTLVIDQSGSMSGDKIDAARRSALSALDQLLPGDRATVVAFGSSPHVLVDQLTIGSGEIEQARQRIRALAATGGTNMLDALLVSAAQAQKIAGAERTNRLLLLSDGQPDTERGLKEQVERLARQGILTTSLGIGRDYNEDLMSRLADAGLGNYYFVERPDQMASIFQKELKALAAVVAKEAMVTIALKDGVNVEEVYGYTMSRGKNVVAIPVGDIYAKHTADLLVRLSVPAKTGHTDLVDVNVTYHDALNQRPVKVARTLEATFTTDLDVIARSVAPAVETKAEAVRTAAALQEASEALAKGQRGRARTIVRAQKARVKSLSDKMIGTSYAPMAASYGAALDELEKDADEEAPADLGTVTKRAKARARKLRR